IMAESIAFLQDPKAHLPTPIPYRQFIAQQLALPETAHAMYFQELLSDVTEPTAPFDMVDVQGDGQAVIETTLPLEAALAQQLRVVSAAQGVTPAVLFHLAWAQVLSQCVGRGDVVFGTVLSGRMIAGAGAEHAVGLFINTLPVRFQLAGLSVQQALHL